MYIEKYHFYYYAFYKLTSHSKKMYNISKTKTCTNHTESNNSEGVFYAIYIISFLR